MPTDPWPPVAEMAERAYPVDPEQVRAEEREACARRIEAWVAARTSCGVTTPYMRGALMAADVIKEGR